MYSGCASQRPLSHLSAPHMKNTLKEWKKITAQTPWNIHMMISLICILILSKVIWRKDAKHKKYLNQWNRRLLSFVIWSRKRARRAEYAPTCEYFGPFTTHLGFIQSNMSLIKSLHNYNGTTSRGRWLYFPSKFSVFDEIFLRYLRRLGLCSSQQCPKMLHNWAESVIWVHLVRFMSALSMDNSCHAPQ